VIGKFYLPALVALLAASPVVASAATTWVSAPVFIGQTTKANGNKAVTYLAAIESAQPNSSGQYELFVSNKPFYQESFADRQAIAMRASCNSTGDDSCVTGNAKWQKYMVTMTPVSQ
jgi:hypothetical protein